MACDALLVTTPSPDSRTQNGAMRAWCTWRRSERACMAAACVAALLVVISIGCARLRTPEVPSLQQQLSSFMLASAPDRARLSSSPSTACVCIASVLPADQRSTEKLAATLESLDAQTVSCFEWHLIPLDESARADTQAFLLSTGADARVLLHPVVTQNARERILRACTAPYAMLLAAGDEVEPTALEKLLWYLHTHPAASFAHGWAMQYSAEAGKAVAYNVNPAADALRVAELGAGLFVHRTPKMNHALQAIGYDGQADPERLTARLLHSYARSNMWGGSVSEVVIHTARMFTPIMLGAQPSEDAPAPPAVLSSCWLLQRPQPPHFMQSAQYDHHPAGSSTRVLLLTPWLVTGGADRFNLDLVLNLAHTHHCRVTIVTTLPSTNSWQHEFQSATLDIIHLPAIVPQTEYAAVVHSVIVSRRIDAVIIANSWHAYSMLPFLRAAHPFVAIMDIIHMVDEQWHGGGHARSSVAMQAYVDGVIVTSEHVRNWMYTKGANRSRIHVHYTGVNLNDWHADPHMRQSFRESYSIPSEAVIVAYVSRLDPQKQPLMVAKIIHKVLSTELNDRPHFVIGGTGWQQDMLLDELHRLPADAQQYVHWIGAVPAAKMRLVLSGSDILLLPSKMEGIPLVFFEAMAVGAIVVGADVGGVAELVQDGITGFLCPAAPIIANDEYKQQQVYQDALITLVKDGALRTRMSAAASNAVTRFQQADELSAIHKHLQEWTVSRHHASLHQVADDGNDVEVPLHTIEAYLWHLRFEHDEAVTHV